MAAGDAGNGAAQAGEAGQVRRAVEWLSALGSRAGDSSEDRLRQGTLILVSVLIVGICPIWSLVYLRYGYPVPAAIPASAAVITVAGLALLTRTKRFAVFRATQLTVYLTFPALLQAALGGFVASSAMILWGIFTPLAALALLGLRRSMWWFAAFLVELCVLALLDTRLTQHAASLPDDLVLVFFVMNILGATVSAYMMLAYFVVQRDRAHRALELERARSERLLLNVLPEPIAQRLKNDASVIAEKFDAVSVLFADLVGFTEQSLVMAPDAMVRLLDQVFSAFDRVADAEGVEKIKTIGDAYMVAGGLPEPRQDHLQAVVRAALAMRAEIASISQQTGHAWLSLRIGIDCGPAVAGVIGRRKFIYDLWGDTVNTASRMESHGLPDEIQVTERVASALGPGFAVRPRGTIDVKGKGLMSTYLVDAGRTVPDPDRADARPAGQRPSQG